MPTNDQVKDQESLIYKVITKPINSGIFRSRMAFCNIYNFEADDSTYQIMTDEKI